MVTTSPSTDVVNELEVTVVVDVAVAMLEVRGLELEVTEVVDAHVGMLGLGSIPGWTS